MVERKTLVVVLAILAVGCGSKELDRAQAKELIQQAKGFDAVSTVSASDDAFGAMTKDKLVKPREFQGWQAMADGSKGSGPWQLTEDGEELFSQLNVGQVGLRTPLHRTVVEVTGITDGAQPGITKVAQFKWHFTDLTEAIAKYTGVTNADHEGEASFRKFDDGWRIEEVKYGTMSDGGNPLPFTLSKVATVEYLGTFTAPEGDDVGYALQLWQDSRPEIGVIGVISYPLMEADSPRCLVRGSYDKSTGSIAVQGDMGDGQPLKFSGQLKDGRLEGTLAGNSMISGKPRSSAVFTRDSDDEYLRSFNRLGKLKKALAEWPLRGPVELPAG